MMLKISNLRIASFDMSDKPHGGLQVIANVEKDGQTVMFAEHINVHHDGDVSFETQDTFYEWNRHPFRQFFDCDPESEYEFLAEVKAHIEPQLPALVREYGFM